jgi:RNA polymerase sigma factor (sigma-70 family)
MFGKDKNQEIIEAILKGQNTRVLNRLYETALPQITKFICANNGDIDEAKDIFQDAVVSLFTTVRLGRFEQGKDVNGFLYFVSRNLWINRIKKRNRQLDISKTQLPYIEDSPHAVYITREKEEVIDRFLELVGSRCKQLLKYVIYDNLSMKEIAVLMDLAGETVAKSAHYRCKQKMMDLVDNDLTLTNFLNNELK